MLLVFVNIALVSAVLIYFLSSIKKVIVQEAKQLVSLFAGNANCPPGPRGVPFLGYLPFMAGRNPYTTFSDLARKYGGLAFVRLGKKNVLVLRDVDMIKEAYKMAAFSGRPNSALKDDRIIGNKGLIQSVGEVWSEHRRLILGAFRDLGLKTASSVTPQSTQMAEVIQRDTEEYLRYISEHVAGKPHGQQMLERLTGRFCGSTISSCVFGVKKAFDDQTFAANVELIEEGFQVGESIAPFEFLPILKKVPGWWDKVEKKVKSNYCRTCSYHGGLIREKMAACEESQPDSFIAIYREEMERKATTKESTTLSEEQLTQTMTDVFCAGTETVKYSLMWAMLYMAEHPEIQKQLQDEIDAAHADSDQPLKWEDISNCPLTEATICEVLRIRPVLPFGHPRSILPPGATFRGRNVPRDTVVLSLIWDVHLDEKLWNKPLEFQPQRFLNDDRRVVKPDCFMPFGAGRRICIGDQMTMMEMFLALSSILNKYTIVPRGGEKVNLDWKILLTLLIPRDFNIELK